MERPSSPRLIDFARNAEEASDRWLPIEGIAYTRAPGRHSSAVEQLFRKQQVLGSNPSVGSTHLQPVGEHSRSGIAAV